MLERTGILTRGNDPVWLPGLILLSDHGDQWQKYIDAVFAIFYRDFIESQPKFKGCWVRCRRDPIYDGKEAGFWHCTSEGSNEEKRIPDLRRCERIGWVRAILEHAEDPHVNSWSNTHHGELRWLLWFQEEFIVIVGERIRKRDGFRYFQLITAYVTEEEHRKRKLRKERDDYYNSLNG